MTGYLIRRVGQAIIVVLGVTFLVFILSRMIPGGEARAALGARALPQAIRQFNRVNGFDLPIWDQFYQYLRNLVESFNLGYSYHYNQSVKALIDERLPKTLVLVGISTVFALVIAVPLGVLQVVRRNKPVDYTLTGFAFIGYSAPAFLIGQLLILYFAIDLRWFSVEAPQGATVGAILGDPRGLVLPVLTLSALTIAAFSRYMRSSMMEAMTQDYIRTARAKGARGARVLFRHALRNALIPIITLIGLSLPGIVGGALITETVFNFPGMGLLTTQAALNTDVPILLGTTFVAALATVAGSLIADILYAVVDPRVRYT
ncbi:MAG TPA: ABC transporter permease [Acidimicrobiales bacterium]|nr:ABC transporter permease [Acidimicrobiales bacterium]